MALLIHADTPIVFEIAKRIRQAVRSVVIISLDADEVRYSIGVPRWALEIPCSFEGLLKIADHHLYQAKQGGCDQVMGSR